MSQLSRILPISRGILVRRQAVCLQQAQFSVGDQDYASSKNHSTDTSWRKNSKYLSQAALLVGAVVSSWGMYQYTRVRSKQSVVMCLSLNKNGKPVGEFKEGLPVYPLDEVAKHDTKEKRIWVTYGRGVYDITDFVGRHPGGKKILIAAGGSLEPFWELYAVHKNPAVLGMVEEFRIGNLSEEDVSNFESASYDPYGHEPKRHPALKRRSEKPFNAEPPASLLADSFITPSELFFVRNHLPMPEMDETTYELEVTGLGVKRPMTLSLKDLKAKFPKYSITATVQCAGNRRSEMVEVKAVKGLNWEQAAIGNATWSGARLCDVLKAAGLAEDYPGVQHVQFEGMDVDVSNVPYGASIPIEKAMNPHGDVLLAYEMNGEPIPWDHGYPVRAIVPGTVGARNVKWLGRIVVSGDESLSHWQQNDYKGFSPSVDWDTVDFSTSPAIQELPIISAICEPVEGDTVKLVDGKLPIRGYAWSGGGQKVIRVDVTADKGKTWHVANITDQDSKANAPRHWSWSLWRAEIPIARGTKMVEVWAKAVDSSYNVQPESFENIWNLRGVLSNAYHRVKILIG